MKLLESIEVETGPNPATSVIVMHGLGADGNDFVPIARELDMREAGAIRYVFPHGPMRPVTINHGMVMRAWYDIIHTDLGGRVEDEAGLRESQGMVEALIARERSRGVAASRIVLAGFSQGCAMTLMTGLRHPERLAGLVALSGYLPLASQTAAEKHAANDGLPIFMGHGIADPVVQLSRAVEGRNALAALGYEVEWHEYAMQHSVSPQEIADLHRWLKRVLAP